MKFDIGGIKYKLSNDPKKCHIETDCFINRRKYENCCLVKDNQYSTSDGYNYQTLRRILPSSLIQDHQQKSMPAKIGNTARTIQDSPRHTYDKNEGDMQKEIDELDNEYNVLINIIILNIDELIKNIENKDYPIEINGKNGKPEILEILKDSKKVFQQLEASVGVSVGGKNTKLSQYKKMLEKKDVKKLYKMAKEMGIKITKKKDGKTSYIKKETIVKKICDAKYKIFNKNSKK